MRRSVCIRSGRLKIGVLQTGITRQRSTTWTTRHLAPSCGTPTCLKRGNFGDLFNVSGGTLCPPLGIPLSEPGNDLLPVIVNFINATKP